MDFSANLSADGLMGEHDNQSGSDRQDLSGGATAQERHVDFASESDTSQNGSDGRGSGRVLAITGCTIAGSSGGTAVAGCSGPTNYEKSKHIEFNQSHLGGPVGIGSTINYHTGPGIQETLEKFAGTYCAHDAAFNSRRMEHEPTCLEDTRVDLLQDIVRWSNAPGDACIFWLNGMAGTGKSTIARTVARIWHDKKQLGASFFFSRGHGDLAHASKFFPTLAYQLARARSSLAADIHKVICDHPHIASQTLRDQWQHLILQPLSQLKDQPEPLIVVIDALDECDDEADTEVILKLLSQAKTLSSVRLLVFVTSRPETPIRLGFHAIPGDIHRDFVLHQIADSVVGRDISVFLRHEFGMIRTRRRLPKEWPTEETLGLLVRKASGLFIYAATVCRFVGHKDSSPENRLNFVLEDSIQDGSPTAQLDLIYTKILRYAVGDQQERLLRFRKIVGSIVILFDALTAVALAELLSAKQWEVEEMLDSLSSILDYSQKIRLLHPSFRDFLLDDRRCSDLGFRIDRSGAHRDLAVNCLEQLKIRLKKDICSLEYPGTLTSEVDSSTIQRCLPLQVQYMCRYWLDHLQRSNTNLRSEARRHNRVHNFLKERFGHWMDVKQRSIELSVAEQLHNQVHTFFKERILHWLEALSLTENISSGILSLKTLESMLTSDADQHLRAIVHDALRFVLHFQSVIEKAPLQIYCSALVFSPKRSILKEQFQNDFPSWITSFPEGNEEWDSLLHILETNFRRVKAMAFSPNGELLASALGDNTVRLWNPTTGICQATLKGHSGSVPAVVFSPDGKLLVSASDDTTVRLWDPTTGSCRATLNDHSHGVTAVVFSSDGKLLVSASFDATIRLWDPAMGTCRATFQGHSDCARAVVFSPDGKLLASASDDTTVRLWDPTTGSCLATLNGHLLGVTAAVFSPDGNLLASASNDETVRLWDPTTGTCRATLQCHSDCAGAVVFSPDGKILATAFKNKTVRLWDPTTGTCRTTLKGHSGLVREVVFSPDGTLLASASDGERIRLWDPTTGSCRVTLRHQPPHKLVFSPNSMILASASFSEIYLSDSSTLTSRATSKRKSKPVNIRMAFSPDGGLLATGIHEETIRLWELTTGTCRATLKGHSSMVLEAVFSPDGKLLASASVDKTVRLWDAMRETCRATLKGHSASVLAVTFSPDSKLLASASRDKTVRLWDTMTGVCRATLRGHSEWIGAVAFSPDGKLLASASDDTTVRLWNPVTGMCHFTLEAHSNCANAVAFSSDGDLLASASCENTVRLWDATAGICRGTAEGHPYGAKTIAFSHDGKTVVTTSSDWTSLYFNIDAVSPTTGRFLSMVGEHPFRTSSSAPLSISGEWIYFGTRKLLCVPPDYQTSPFAIQNKSVVVKHRSGEICFFAFDFSLLPLGELIKKGTGVEVSSL